MYIIYPCFFQSEGKLPDFATSGDRKGNRRLERLVNYRCPDGNCSPNNQAKTSGFNFECLNGAEKARLRWWWMQSNMGGRETGFTLELSRLEDDELWIAQLISTLRPYSHFTSYLCCVRPCFGSNNLEKHLVHHRWNFPVGHRTGIALWSKLDNLNVRTLLDSASTPAVCPMDHPSSLLAVTSSNYPLFSHSFLWTVAQDRILMSLLLCSASVPPAPSSFGRQCILGILTMVLSFPYQVTSLFITPHSVVFLSFVVKSYEPCVIGFTYPLLLRLLTLQKTFDHQAVQIPFPFMASVSF